MNTIRITRILASLMCGLTVSGAIWAITPDTAQKIAISRAAMIHEMKDMLEAYKQCECASTPQDKTYCKHKLSKSIQHKIENFTVQKDPFQGLLSSAWNYFTSSEPNKKNQPYSWAHYTVTQNKEILNSFVAKLKKEGASLDEIEQLQKDVDVVSRLAAFIEKTHQRVLEQKNQEIKELQKAAQNNATTKDIIIASQNSQIKKLYALLKAHNIDPEAQDKKNR